MKAAVSSLSTMGLPDMIGFSSIYVKLKMYNKMDGAVKNLPLPTIDIGIETKRTRHCLLFIFFFPKLILLWRRNRRALKFLKQILGGS